MTTVSVTPVTASSAGYALDDLSNVAGSDFAGVNYAAVSGGKNRSLLDRGTDKPCVLDWNGSTFLQRLQAATAAMTSGGQLIVPAGSYTADTGADGPLTITKSGFEIASARRAGIITFSGPGPHIKVGSDTIQANDVGFRGLYMIGAAGEALIQTRWARGVRFYGVKVQADGFLILGDDTLGTTKYTYIVELYDGCELNQLASPTRHFVHCRNFGGQWINYGSFCEGIYASGIHGFYVADNIMQRVDDSHIVCGYWSRFDRNYDFTDGRITNFKMIGHHCENALNEAMHFEVTSATTKDIANVGAEGVSIIGGRFDGARESIYIKCNRSGAGFALFHIANIQQTGASGTRGAVYIESAAGLVSQIGIDGVRGDTSPSNSSRDWITVIGADSPSSATVDGILIDNVSGRSKTGTSLRSQVRTEGTANVGVKVSGNLGAKATSRISDTSGVTAREPSGVTTTATTLSFGTIGPGSTNVQDVTMTGARSATDVAFGNITGGSFSAKAVVRYAVVATDTVRVSVQNTDPTNSITVNSISFILELRQYH